MFDKLHHVSDMWVKVKTSGRDCKYHFKTHLPRELAEHKSSLLKERIDMRKDDERLPVHVVEIKGYPQLEIKDNHGKWTITKAYKDRYNN